MTPKQREIDTSDGPIVDVFFSQFRADVNVNVICIGLLFCVFFLHKQYKLSYRTSIVFVLKICLFNKKIATFLGITKIKISWSA